MRLEYFKNKFNQTNITTNNNLFLKIILEPKGVKSNYFGEDLEKLNRKRPDGLIQGFYPIP